MGAYRDKGPPEGTKRGECPDCRSPDVVLYPFQYEDPHWWDDPTYSPPCQAPILTKWQCQLCRDAPMDPRAAICYVGNLILRALK